MAIVFGFKSDIGKVRTNNEDSFIIDEQSGLFIVADGMGGHNSGEVASRMACDIISKNLQMSLKRQAEPDRTQVMFGQTNPALSDTANRMVSAIRLANQVVFEASQSSPQNNGMGTTVVALLTLPSSYIIAWVGDSRIYLVRHNQLQQLTTDHSLVQEQINKGLITSEQAEKSEFKNILTRAIGAAATVEVDATEIPAFADDYLILCSDGLSRMVTDEQILETVRAYNDPQKISDTLVERANAAGGKDNVTAVVVGRQTEGIWGKFLKAVGKAN